MPLLQVEDLTKTFKGHASLFGRNQFNAVDKVSFTLERKQTLAIIGNNGSGKSTLVKMIAGIIPPTSGRILFNDRELQYQDAQSRAKHIRMVFQDANSAFNPRLNIGQILDEPLSLATDWTETQRNEKKSLRPSLLLDFILITQISILSISLSAKSSGLPLARALILAPEIIIIDDAIGNLDASVRIQLLNLTLDLQQRLGISYIYVGQDLGVIKHIADTIIVMDDGKMIEYGSPQNLFY